MKHFARLSPLVLVVVVVLGVLAWAGDKSQTAGPVGRYAIFSSGITSVESQDVFLLDTMTGRTWRVRRGDRVMPVGWTDMGSPENEFKPE